MGVTVSVTVESHSFRGRMQLGVTVSVTQAVAPYSGTGSEQLWSLALPPLPPCFPRAKVIPGSYTTNNFIQDSTHQITCKERNTKGHRDPQAYLGQQSHLLQKTTSQGSNL